MTTGLDITEKSILIVDDMKTIREKLKQLCYKMGIKNIHMAVDGVSALELLQTTKVDLVLSDWNMPNMTGIELVQQIRQDPKLANLPVIFITSEDQKENILKSIMIGVTDYIVKPFPDAVVKQKVFNALKIQPPKV